MLNTHEAPVVNSPDSLSTVTIIRLVMRKTSPTLDLELRSVYFFPLRPWCAVSTYQDSSQPAIGNFLLAFM